LSIPIGNDEFEDETLMYAAGNAYEALANNEMPMHHSVRSAEPMGEPWEEDKVDARFPELAAKWNEFHESAGEHFVEEIKQASSGIAGFFRKLLLRPQ
jgi:hypothetical protein